jgi:hypothetical protein
MNGTKLRITLQVKINEQVEKNMKCFFRSYMKKKNFFFKNIIQVQSRQSKQKRK